MSITYFVIYHCTCSLNYEIITYTGFIAAVVIAAVVVAVVVIAASMHTSSLAVSCLHRSKNSLSRTGLPKFFVASTFLSL